MDTLPFLELLQQHSVGLEGYDLEDLEQDMQTLQRLETP